MSDLQTTFNDYKEVLLESKEFLRYQKAKEVLSTKPAKHKRVQELRKKNYTLQNSKDGTDLFTESDRLMNEYKDVYADSEMKEYLEAENAICRIIQTAYLQLIECMDFEGIFEEE